MPGGNNTEVNYSFTGDVSSLQTAAAKALSLLDQIEFKFKAAATTGDFGSNKKKTKGFQTSLKALGATITEVQSKLQGLGASKLPTASVEALQFTKNVQNIQGVLNAFDMKAKYTTKDVESMTSAIKSSTEVFKSSSVRLEDYVLVEDKFAQKLQKVRNVSEKVATGIKTTGTKISTTAGNIHSSAQKMGSGVAKAASSIASSVKNRVATPFVALKAIIQSFKDKAAAALNHAKRMAEAAGAGFRVFKGDTEDAAAAHSRLAKSAQQTEKAIEGTAQSVDKEDKELNKNDKQLSKSADKHTTFSSILKKTIDVIKSSVSHIRSIANVFKKLTSSVDITGKALKGLAKFMTGAAVGKYLSSAINAVADYISNINLFNVAVGSANEQASKFVKTMAETYGLDPSGIYRSVGYFSELTAAIGHTKKASTNMALSLTKAAADISSLFNIDIETVQQNLAMGLEGQSRAVRKYGIDIQRATLQETAHKYGIETKVSAMSEASRQALRYITILDQVRDSIKQEIKTTDGATQSIGDFARMIESPANQLRVLKDQIKQLATTIGSLFLPVLQRALPLINGFVMAVRTLLQVLAKLLGVNLSGFGKSTAGAADNVTAIGDAASDAADKMKQLVAPFDELNILSEKQGSSGGASITDDELVDPQLAELLDKMSLELDKVRMKALDVRDAILAAFGVQIDEEGNFSISIGGFIDDLENLWKNADYTGFGERIAEFINKGINWAVNTTSREDFGAKFSGIVSSVAQAFNGLFNKLDAKGLGRTLANVFNTAINTLYAWLTTRDYSEIGTKIGENLNEAIQNIDWEKLGATIGTYFMSKISLLGSLISEFDWTQFGESLSTGVVSLVQSIDFEAVVSAVLNLIKGLMATAIAALPGLLESTESIVTQIASAIEQDAPELISTATQLMSTFLTGIVRSLPSILRAGLSIIKALAMGLIQSIPELVKALPEIISGLVTAIIEFIPEIAQAGVELITALLQETPTIIQNIVEGSNEILSSIVRAVIEAIPDLAKAGIDLFVALVQNLPDIITQIAQALPELIFGIVEALIDNIDVIIEAGIQLFVALIENLPAIIAGIVRALPKLVEGIAKGVVALVGKMIEAGGRLIEGLWQGISDSVSWLWQKISGWVDDLWTWIKDLLGIHSPSDKTEAMGEFLVEGLFEGLDTVGNQATKWSKSVLGDIQDVLGASSSALGMQNVGDELSESLGDTNVFVGHMVNMYQDMANQCVFYIDSIADALNRLPQDITTIYTIVAQSTATQSTGYVSQLASRGSVTRPTLGLVSASKYPEVSVKSKETSDIEDAISRYLEKVDSANGQTQQPIEVRLYIGDKEWDQFTYESAQRGKKLTGAQPVQTGG